MTANDAYVFVSVFSVIVAWVIIGIGLYRNRGSEYLFWLTCGAAVTVVSLIALYALIKHE